ncbi:MAG: nitronate monooxygenase [Desulfobacteraceae bacterium]|nr:nitronate monooxygenase [Desulfobacteraceae bacterium]
MRFDNNLTRMLGVKYPIIQGAFGWKGTGSSKIAVPVSEAGGLGILTTISYKNPDEFQEDIRHAKAMTNKPFAVNFTLMKGTKYNNDYHEDYIKITLDEGIKTIFTSAYDGSYIGKIFKDAGCNWIHKCATIRHAVSIGEKGVDAVVIVGLEGTGYKNPDQNSTMINMTAARRLIKVPLIAAGGIGDARGFVAALAMGASGIYMGTSFMATEEFAVPDTLKNKIVNQEILDSEYSKKIYGLDHGGAHSLASVVVDSIPTVKEYIDQIIKESEEIISEFRQWGMME